MGHVIIIYFRIFRWPLFQIFSNFNPSNSFRMSGTAGKISHDKSSPCITNSAWEGWEGFTEQAPCVNITEHIIDLFQGLSAPLSRANTKVFRKVPQNHCSIASYLIFSFVICRNLVQILSLPRQFHKAGQLALWQQMIGREGCLLFPHKGWEGRWGWHTCKDSIAFSSLCYYCLCQFLNRKVPFSLCSCK